MEVRRVYKRNRGLDLSACVDHRAAKPGFGVVLGTRMTTAFSLYDDGPTARFLYEDVGTAAAFENLACLLASGIPTSAQQAQHLAQGDVQRVFVRGACHDRTVTTGYTSALPLLAGDWIPACAGMTDEGCALTGSWRPHALWYRASTSAREGMAVWTPRLVTASAPDAEA